MSDNIDQGKKLRILVAMSGGVDSSVAAFELKKAGYEVEGVTIKMWPEGDCGSGGERACCSLESIQFARSVAEDLKIPFHVVDLSPEFDHEVTEYFLKEYLRGRTPNPCIYCNSSIKFGHLYKWALSMGIDKIATGHYARIIELGGEYLLSASVDKRKDQSYFLYNIPKEVIPNIVFPLGGYTKDQVREIALSEGFTSAERKESQDICFAGDKGYKEYIAQRMGHNRAKEGDILDIDGAVIGRHEGITSYTVGQRKGTGVAMGRPVYVLSINAVDNTIVLGDKDHAMKKKISVTGVNWLLTEDIEGPENLCVKIRYGSSKVKAVVSPSSDGVFTVEFDEPQFAPTPGQAAVFYKDEIVAGGGWIDKTC